MRAITGVFTSSDDAATAVERLRVLLPAEAINVLTPASSEREIHAVPTTEDMPPVGGKMAAILGGALGVGAGLVLPGVGVAVGVAAAALLGTLGGAAGYEIGSHLDRAGSQGLPIDELYVYEDALHRGRTVVIAMVEDQAREDAVEKALEDAGAESLDEARHGWWHGLRDAEEREYPHGPEAFVHHEPLYQRGFQSALAPHARGRTWDEARADLARRFPKDHGAEAFRRGFERGQRHARERDSGRH